MKIIIFWTTKPKILKLFKLSVICVYIDILNSSNLCFQSGSLFNEKAIV